MGYSGPRRKSKLQKACEALDPSVRLEGPIRIGYSPGYIVRDRAGVEIGWTDGNEGTAKFAWLRALDTLQRRQLTTAVVAAIKGKTDDLD